MKFLSEKISVLDHGYVEPKEFWGSDERIIEAARQSTGGGFVSWEPYPNHPKGDSGLLRYLYRNKHMTPFEMCGATFEVQLPIFVTREWHRHRTQSYSEASARYAPLPDLYFLPEKSRLFRKNEDNKQANAVKGAELLTDEAAEAWLTELGKFYDEAEALYQEGLRIGIPKEIARVVMPVGHYTRMYASGNLRNWMQFLALRQDGAAQEEIRVYADAVADALTKQFPRTMELFNEAR